MTGLGDVTETKTEFTANYNILLAEDIPMNQELTMAMLKKNGHAVTVVSNGLEAVDAVKKDQYDLILMDVQMPEMGGMEATEIIREQLNIDNTTTPIVALTAHVQINQAIKFYQVGMDDYIIKPVSPDDLQKKISEVIEGPLLDFVEPTQEQSTPEEDLQDFNKDTFKAMIEFVGEEDAAQLINSFFKDASARMERVNESEESSEEIKKDLHSLVSMSGYLGFEKLSAICRHLVDEKEELDAFDISKVNEAYLLAIKALKDNL